MREITMYGVTVKLNDERADLIEGKWESERLSAMLENIHPGTVVFDVGAEEGDMSVMMALKGARMVLFEPSPSMWPKIKRNFDANKLTPTLCFAGFASDRTTESPVQGADFDTSMRGVWPTVAFDPEVDVRSFRHLSEQAVATPEVTIDDFCDRNNIRPDLLTIDVERAEWNVLTGARKTLTTGSPLVYVSVHNNLLWQMYGHWFHDIYWEYLMDMGYRPEFLAHNHETHFLFRKTGALPD